MLLSFTIEIIPSHHVGRNGTPSDYSLPNHLNHHPLRSPPVELPIKNLFPRTEIEPPGGDCYDDLATHDLPLHVGVGVVLAGAVVAIALRRRMEGSQLL